MATTAVDRDRLPPRGPTARRFWLIVRLVLAATLFALVTAGAFWELEHAIRHVGEVWHFDNGYFRGDSPTYCDVVFAFLIGPITQVVIFAGVICVSQRWGRDRQRSLSVASWWLLVLDAVLALFVYAVSAASVI
jgi:hypothetical protein